MGLVWGNIVASLVNNIVEIKQQDQRLLILSMNKRVTAVFKCSGLRSVSVRESSKSRFFYGIRGSPVMFT